MLSKNFSFDNSKTTQKLGINFDPDTYFKVASNQVYDMMEHGMLEDKRPKS